MTELVLSLFPGIGLLDRAFAAAGFCIVQAADKITGGDVRDFRGVPGRLDGIVACPVLLITEVFDLGFFWFSGLIFVSQIVVFLFGSFVIEQFKEAKAKRNAQGEESF